MNNKHKVEIYVNHDLMYFHFALIHKKCMVMHQGHTCKYHGITMGTYLIVQVKWLLFSFAESLKAFFLRKFLTFCDNNMVAKYQGMMVAKYLAQYQGISLGQVWDVWYVRIVTTKIMYVCNISGTIWCTDMYDISF